MRISRGLAAATLLTVGAVNFLAACTPEDDSDSLPATPTPAPLPPDRHCQVVWTNLGTAGLIDVFVIDGPEESWTIAGTGTFDEFVGWYQPGVLFDTENNVLSATLNTQGAMISSADTFAYTLSINTTSPGSDLTVEDVDPNTLYAVDEDGEPTTSVFSTNATFTFDGVWSSDDPGADLEEADGMVTIVLTGTAGDTITVGDFGNYAVCYDIAEAHSHQRATPLTTLRRKR